MWKLTSKLQNSGSQFQYIEETLGKLIKYADLPTPKYFDLVDLCGTYESTFWIKLIRQQMQNNSTNQMIKWNLGISSQDSTAKSAKYNPGFQITQQLSNQFTPK